MDELSPLEQRLFDGLRQYLDEHHYSPNIDELQEISEKPSRQTVQEALLSLKRKGYIDWQFRKGRTYRVLKRGIPLLGVIQAGAVVEHPADLVELVDLPGVPYYSNQYALRVCGDSMIGAHICEGDLVVLRPNVDLWSIKRETIAAVWVEGEGVTLKYIELDGEWILLKPANPNYETRRVKQESVFLQGIFVKVHRDYENLD